MASSRPKRIPPTRRPQTTRLQIDSQLAIDTLAVLLRLQVGDVYNLIKRWEEAAPALFRPTVTPARPANEENGQP
jgi:hypothetical protein